VWTFLIRVILRNRVAILVIIGVITLFMGYQATKVQLQYEGTSILPSSDSTIITYKNFIHQFGEDGTIMFMGKKWPTGCPEATPLTICLIPKVKFMIYKEDKKIWEFHL
jgi:hypothetical protein